MLGHIISHTRNFSAAASFSSWRRDDFPVSSPHHSFSLNKAYCTRTPRNFSVESISVKLCSSKQSQVAESGRNICCSNWKQTRNNNKLEAIKYSLAMLHFYHFTSKFRSAAMSCDAGAGLASKFRGGGDFSNICSRVCYCTRDEVYLTTLL